MSELPLPQWAYVPGETFEADADFETLAQVKLLVPSAFRVIRRCATASCSRPRLLLGSARNP